MGTVYCAAAAFILDLILGDPERIPHPVVIMGRVISAADRSRRRKNKGDPAGDLRSGILLAVMLPVLTLIISGAAVFIAWKIHPAAAVILNTFWCYQCLSVKTLGKESRLVKEKLVNEPLENARKQVGRIVGRDTAELTREGVIKACVESVAESFSDGITAPLFFMLIGGAPLALCYKSVNTMDSMIGYKNSDHEYFGRAAAKLDDAANIIPSRISALILIASAYITGNDASGAYRIWKRDRRNHESPNAAQTESAAAGALGIRLAGPASYFGKIKDKPYIGDDIRKPVPEDIDRMNRMMYAGSVISLIAFCVIRTVLVIRIGALV